MDFYVAESHNLVVGWSPKCACTAVCDWLVRGVINPTMPFKGKARIYLRDNGYLREPHEAIDLIVNEKFKSVFFVRNPITRLASGYIDKFICRRGKPLTYPVNYEQFVINTIADLYKVNKYIDDYKGISFFDLLSYIEFCIKADRILDHHWMPQAAGVNEELKKHIRSNKSLVVKQESFRQNLVKINSALGISYLPPRINVTQLPKEWIEVSENSDYSHVTNEKILERRDKITRRNILSNETKSAIGRIYRDDFELFSYPKP